MNTTISEAAVEAAESAFSNKEGWPSDMQMRAALEAALPHLRPTKPEAVRLRDELGERGTLAATLRAMATNYSGGHSWDHLDADVCRRAADALASVQPSPAGQSGEVQWVTYDDGGEYYAEQHGGGAWATYRRYGNGWVYNFGNAEDAEVRAKSVARELNRQVEALAARQPVGDE